MTSKNMIAQTETILKYCVLGLLIVFALATLFAFVINWETWFFGRKLDGLPAGIALGVTWLAAALLAAALIKFPRMDPLLGGLTAVYFGFLFVNSSMTIQKVSYTHQGFSPVLAAFAILSIAFFIVALIKRYQENSKIRP
ncbi:hypothetical protein Mboo_0367 [Methanoregula boonei 6A8]|uniref:Uncharacterized protein n=1 Tax=Methanoregula boonei (strain DSM 21154 / JCM 14090 / 6A8) TaxID=456442 RepID=A7I576_METB6|nr:hypothetical protein [Methanoregula boonei]ABS54887.1 hypothetical protein Mboo_0367 [Methanoregula boonei 6A8]